MPRRVAVAVLSRPTWSPPGTDPVAWRLALAEDVVDVLATLAEVEPAIAVAADEADLRRRVGWPGLRGYELPALDAPSIFAAAAADGFDQAVLLAADAPDLPGLLIAKLLRPLTSHPVAAAPAVLSSQGADLPEGNLGLLGLSTVLPAPGWLPGASLDELTPQAVRRLAPQASDVAGVPGWHRLRGPDDLRRLDPRLEGWEATRALLTAGSRTP